MNRHRTIVPGTFTLPFERRNRPGSPGAQRGTERAALARTVEPLSTDAPRGGWLTDHL